MSEAAAAIAAGPGANVLRRPRRGRRRRRPGPEPRRRRGGRGGGPRRVTDSSPCPALPARSSNHVAARPRPPPGPGQGRPLPSARSHRGVVRLRCCVRSSLGAGHCVEYTETCAIIADRVNQVANRSSTNFASPLEV